MGHELTVTLPEQPIIVDADLTRLAQVFSNLLNNSAKYTDRGGHIWLTAERQGSDVVVSVKDTGIGIAADQLPRIFEMFSQVDRSLERSQGGLGIGLTLVKRLVEMHGGPDRGPERGAGQGGRVRRPPAGRRGGIRAAGSGREGRATGPEVVAPHPDRGRQPGQRRQPGDAAADHGQRHPHGLRRAGGGGRGRGVPARRDAARHRPAEAERLRGVPPHPGTAVGQGAWSSSP